MHEERLRKIQSRPLPQGRTARVAYLFRVLRAKEKGLERHFCPDAVKDADALRQALRGELEPLCPNTGFSGEKQ